MSSTSPNEFLTAFHQKLDRRFSKAYDGQTTYDWVRENTTLGGMPFSIAGYEFQEAILNDDHPNMDVIKPSQVGLSEVQVRKALAFVCRQQRVSMIFTLPDEKLFRRMSQTRIQPMIQRDKVFNLDRDAEAVRSMGIVQCGDSFLYITACTESDATSTAADAVMNDELDLSDQNMIALFNSRMQNSDIRINQRFSTPTFQNYGIDSGFKISDQHQYLHKCVCCGHWNHPEFDTRFCYFPDLPKHVENLMDLDADEVAEMDLAKCYVRCEKCLKPLEGERQWVAKFPGRVNNRGYQVTPFSTSRIGLAYIVDQLVKYKRRDYLRGFYNTVLGSTYSDARTQIPLEAIEASMKKGSPHYGELPKGTPLTLGIDMGQTCHLVVADASGRNVLAMEAIPVGKLVDRVKHLLANHNFISGAVDRLPYTPTAEEIRTLSSNIIVPVQYAETKDADIKLVLDSYGLLSHAHANRTKVLDEVADDFRNYIWSLSGYGHQKQIIVEQLRDMVREEKPEQPAKWVKLTGNDHYFHALALLRAGLRLRPLVLEFQGKGNYELMDFGAAQFGVKQQGLMGYSGAGLPGR